MCGVFLCRCVCVCVCVCMCVQVSKTCAHAIELQLCFVSPPTCAGIGGESNTDEANCVSSCH